MSEILTKQVFEAEEDELLDYECGSEDILKTTAHEDAECSTCHLVFDMWEDAYRKQASKPADELLICEDCYDKLPD